MNKILMIATVLAFGVFFSCSSEDNKSSDKLAQNPNLQVKNDSNIYNGTIKLTKQDFLEKVMNYEVNTTEWKYEGDLPCLIDFYADWCAPCRQAAPILEELAKEYAGKIYIYKVDTQKEMELASVFRIQGIPAFLYCPMEGKPQMTSGIGRTPEATKAMFKQYIDQLLLAKEETL